MSTRKQPLTKLLLTRRAIADLVEIEAYSIEKLGKRTANKDLTAIKSGLQLIRENQAVLRQVEGLPDDLKCYRVNKHILLCDVQPESIVALTVSHGSVDIPDRLAELSPKLAEEVVFLHDKLISKRKK